MSELALFVVSVVIAFWLFSLAILAMFSSSRSYEDIVDSKSKRVDHET